MSGDNWNLSTTRSTLCPKGNWLKRPLLSRGPDGSDLRFLICPPNRLSTACPTHFCLPSPLLRLSSPRGWIQLCTGPQTYLERRSALSSAPQASLQQRELVIDLTQALFLLAPARRHRCGPTQLWRRKRISPRAPAASSGIFSIEVRESPPQAKYRTAPHLQKRPLLPRSLSSFQARTKLVS